MLHLEIQKEKEDMKASNLQQEIGGTAACMKILMMSTKGYVQLTSNYTYFADSCFSGVKMDAEATAEGVAFSGRLRRATRIFV